MKSVLGKTGFHLGWIAVTTGLLMAGATGTASAASGDLHGPYATYDQCKTAEAAWTWETHKWANPNWDCIPSQGPGGAGAGYYFMEN